MGARAPGQEEQVFCTSLHNCLPRHRQSMPPWTANKRTIVDEQCSVPNMPAVYAEHAGKRDLTRAPIDPRIAPWFWALRLFDQLQKFVCRSGLRHSEMRMCRQPDNVAYHDSLRVRANVGRGPIRHALDMQRVSVGLYIHVPTYSVKDQSDM